MTAPSLRYSFQMNTQREQQVTFSSRYPIFLSLLVRVKKLELQLAARAKTGARASIRCRQDSTLSFFPPPTPLSPHGGLSL